jgi:hypothetical protein
MKNLIFYDVSQNISLMSRKIPNPNKIPILGLFGIIWDRCITNVIIWDLLFISFIGMIGIILDKILKMGLY